jgi:hypothetical protein
MDAFYGEGRSARPLRDGAVLCLYDGARRGVAIEAAEDFARHLAIGALRAVFVNHVEKRELDARCGLPCHFGFLSWFDAGDTTKDGGMARSFASDFDVVLGRAL